MLTKDFKFEVKSVNEDGTFEGYLSVFDVVDLGGDLVEKGAFTKTLQEAKNGFVKLLWQHDTSKPIGKLFLEEDDYGLKARGQLVLGIPQAMEAYVLLKEGIISSLSIGYKAIQKQMEKGVRRLKEIQLYEGSIVTFPMLPEAEISSVKEAQDLSEEFAEIIGELKAGRAISAERSARLRSIINEIQSLLEGAEPVAAVTELTLEEEPKGSAAIEPDIHLLLKNFKFTETLNVRS